MPILAQNRPKLNCYFLPDSLEGRRVQTRHQSYGLRWRGVLSEPCQHLVPSWLLAETMSAIIVSAGFFPPPPPLRCSSFSVLQLPQTPSHLC